MRRFSSQRSTRSTAGNDGAAAGGDSFEMGDGSSKKPSKAERKAAKAREKEALKALKKGSKRNSAVSAGGGDAGGDGGAAAAADTGGMTIPETSGWRLAAARIRPLEDARKQVCESWTSVQRHHRNKKSEDNVLIRMDLGRLCVEFAGGKAGGKAKSSGRIPLSDISEVRVGALALECKTFRDSPDYAGVRPELALVVLHGAEFRLVQTCLVFAKPAERDAWGHALSRVMPLNSREMYKGNMLLRAYLETQLHNLLPDGAANFGLKHIKAWVKRLKVKLSAREIKDLYERGGAGSDRTLTAVRMMYTALFQQQCEELAALRMVKTTKEGRVSAKALSEFYKGNDAGLDMRMVEDTVRRYSWTGAKELDWYEWCEFVHSSDNDVRQSVMKNVQPYMDMDQPLAHYFINSSHNTYLMGDQLWSESSPECYTVQLRDGVRSLEIDTWDGTGQFKGEPIVYHGYTRTTKILFRDVLPAIRRDAFWKNRYPLVLSIENHCSVSMQKVMADLFKKEFGECLVTEPLPECRGASQYPSPNQLRGRIIIKHKKLLEGALEVEKSGHQEDTDISSSRINGYLNVMDPIDQSWEKHYFVLSKTHLTYGTPQEEPAEDELEDEEEEETAADAEEFGEEEEWFHGKIEGGRKVAEKLVHDFVGKSLPQDVKADGTFLVRASESDPSGYTLTFWREGVAKPVQHLRIMRDKDTGMLRVNEVVAFNSLYELVEYHRRAPLITKEYEVLLRCGVPNVSDHAKEPWFFGDISRNGTEQRLFGTPDGTFLVRTSESSAQEAYAVSFRAANKTKHCLVRKEDRWYVIGEQRFPSLTKIVNHYQEKPLFRKVKLKYPADDEFISTYQSASAYKETEEIYSANELYAEPNTYVDVARSQTATKTACKALTGFRGDPGKGELPFPKGAVIINVVQHEQGNWEGEYNGRKGSFPPNYVEMIDAEEMEKASATEHENVLGENQKATMPIKAVRLEDLGGGVFRVINAEASTAVDVRSIPELAATGNPSIDEWVKAIREATSAPSRAATRETIKLKMKITPELSDLIYYSHSVPFKSWEFSEQSPFQHMSSWKEAAAFKTASDDAKNWNDYCKRQLARVYPAGTRVNSSNFDPQPLWNCGVQLVAMNLQTPDRGTWLNHGFFEQNGGCGYVLKPKAMLKPKFDPMEVSTFDSGDSCVVCVTVFSARHLTGKGTLSCYVEVEVTGVSTDRAKYKTKPVLDGNGLCPVWKEKAGPWEVMMPELASLGFVVYNTDMFGDPHPVAQRYLPIGGKKHPLIRHGWHSIKLKNPSGRGTGLTSLLVHIDITRKKLNVKNQEKKQEYQRLLRQQDDLVKEKQHLITSGGDAVAIDSQLKLLREKLSDMEANYTNL